MILSPIWNRHPNRSTPVWLGRVGFNTFCNCVQFAHAERSPVHRAKNLHVADRVETKPFWNSLLHQLDEHCRDLLRVIPLDEMEIGTRVCSAHVRHLSSADAVCVGDDVAARRLTEHFGESHNWYDSTLDQVLKHRAGPNGRKLIYIADQNQSGAVRNRPQKGMH